MLNVRLKMTWAEMLGSSPKDFTPEVRRERWNAWKVLAIKNGDQEMVNYWAKDNIDEGCSGCIYRDKDWCNLQGLPCNINPILTIKAGIIGMACYGTGYETKQQLELF